MNVVNELGESGFMAALVRAEGVAFGPSPGALTGRIAALVDERAGQEFPPESLRTAVRRLLKKGGFKPTGRNKPASEYLAQAAREGRFPLIANLVDINNYVSLLSGLPASLLDLDVTGESMVLRLGREGESYTFNASGQVIDLRGLICLCRAGGAALGNPVKDSVEAKVSETTKRVVGVIYACRECVGEAELEEKGRLMAALLAEHAGAGETEVFIL
jgi:DNA/RNA-binding domain of Phe-tRNA-synthetase-like protein